MVGIRKEDTVPDNVEMPIRLAFRTEGEFVNAYIALTDTMANALLIGSIRRGILDRDETIWVRWKELMLAALSNAIEDQFDQTPTFDEQRAPEHEKAGEA